MKFQVESGKTGKSSSWGHKRGYIQGKGGKTPATEEGPLFLSYREEEAMVVEEAGKDRRMCHLASSCFRFLCEVRSKVCFWTWVGRERLLKAVKGQGTEGKGRPARAMCVGRLHRVGNPVEAYGHYLKCY